MAKNLKINIKNTQIAQAINLNAIKGKLAKKKPSPSSKKEEDKSPVQKVPEKENKEEALVKEEAPRIRARSKSAFSETVPPITQESEKSIPSSDQTIEKKTRTGVKEEIVEEEASTVEKIQEEKITPSFKEEAEILKKKAETAPQELPTKRFEQSKVVSPPVPPSLPPIEKAEVKVKLGPTGKHISDFLPHKYAKETDSAKTAEQAKQAKEAEDKKAKPKIKGEETKPATTEEEDKKEAKQRGKYKEFKDLKPAKKQAAPRAFDARDRHGFGETDEDFVRHRKKRGHKLFVEDTPTVRPAQLKIRVPISIKDLASEMKLKSSELITKLFENGLVATINTQLDDPTTIELLAHEFGCQITIDTSEEERIRISDQTVEQEIEATDTSQLVRRAPIVAFMGHVDHGKTSLIDAIRKSNRVSGEAGAITQHIGAFRCSTAVGDITIFDTPGHEAFSAMRERGAHVTDIVVLVIAGDEGIKPQTVEAIQHARKANVTIVVALNKSDKPSFNAENVYRQLADQELLPEAWGGQTITVNCSAKTGEGISTLLEMLALQAEVLELTANPSMRARGTVLESEMHKGLGVVATIIVQNGTLKIGDAIVSEQHWGRIKTMRDEHGKEMQSCGPSVPASITGLSGLPVAGEEFFVVKHEREAKEIAEARLQGARLKNLQQVKTVSLENMLQKASDDMARKQFNVVIRADVQGSLEALKTALQKIESSKVDLNIVFAGIGEISESDIQMASISKAIIIGFHTAIESHAEPLIKQLGITIRMHDVIYHAIDDVKELMAASLDKIAQENERGKAVVKALFKSSHHGVIAGCIVTEGSIVRNHLIRVRRGSEIVWKGQISSLKRVKEDVKEVQKGIECGILLANYNAAQVDDILEAYDITYIAQEL